MRELVYKCTKCGRVVGRANLKTKRVQFQEMGKGAIISSRITAWLCIVPQEDGSPSCLETDPDYGLPLYAKAPGMAGTIIARENEGT